MIDENKLKEQLFALAEQIGDERLHIDAVVHLIDEAPTVDAVEVVRCKDCKHWRNFVRSPIQDEVIKSGKLWKYCCKVNEMMPEDGYCHRAERERKNELER